MPGWKAIEVLLNILVNHVKPLLPFLASDGVLYILASARTSFGCWRERGTRWMKSIWKMCLKRFPKLLSPIGG
jgi:hypothetical protein